MRFNPFKPSDPIAKFWGFFASHAHEYELLQGDPHLEKKLSALGSQLRHVDDRLSFEFSTNLLEAPEFIISADGNPELFPIVLQLVNAAPTIGNWKILAFRQRGGIESEIVMGDVKLGAPDLWFSLEENGDRVGLHLYFLNVEITTEIVYASFLLLDNALGEYDVETKIGFVERHHLAPDAERTHLQPFSQLPAAFDTFWALTQR